MSGVLKNALDRALPPLDDMPLSGKPAAMMGAPQGGFGTARAQMHLRQMSVHTNLPTLNWPQVLVARAEHKFDEQGRLLDKTSRRFVRSKMAELAVWTRGLQWKPQGR